jgi:hypothetical protein
MISRDLTGFRRRSAARSLSGGRCRRPPNHTEEKGTAVDQ